VGSVQKIEGKAVVRHQDQDYGFLIKEDLALYNGDTLYTAGNGRLVFVLKDGSSLSLASDTKMVIDKSIYNPDAGQRLSFFQMLAGKARVVVKKLVDYKRSQFNVKTESSVVGVRGSDFIVEVTQQGNRTVITALGNTVLEVVDPAHPLRSPVIVTSYQQLITVLGEVIGSPVDIPEEEIRRRLDELGLLSPDGGGTGGGAPGPGGTGGGYVPDGGQPQYPRFGSSLPFLSSGGPTNPLPPPIDDPGPDDTNNDDPADEIRPPAPFPELPDMPEPPAAGQ